ncbi:MAG: hypothetical protein GXX96_09935 [Planctomycetaceae bacterium]|nr:hypothetical protein [Planctomycetaceae bacterium]
MPEKSPIGSVVEVLPQARPLDATVDAVSRAHLLGVNLAGGSSLFGGYRSNTLIGGLTLAILQALVVNHGLEGGTGFGLAAGGQMHIAYG